MSRDLGQRLDALTRAVELGNRRLDPALLEPARGLLDRSGIRRSLAPEYTVVALAGGTGSGKSTLFNRLAGTDLAPTSVRRPTTSRSRAAIWRAGPAEAGPLLEWLDVRDRHLLDGRQSGGLVLLDLPDYDSTSADHRAEAERMAGVVDLLIWVVDPQKYADAALHERYLRPLATHRDVMLVALNQVDRLDAAAADSCRRDLARLLAADGLRDVPVFALSAARGDGVPRLQETLARRVRERTAAVDRLHADLDAVVAGLADLCAGRKRPAQDDAALAAALERAAGVPVVADAAAEAYRRRARASVGWPPTRWLARRKPDPLRRLHLGPGDAGPVSTAPAGAADATVGNALRDLVEQRTAGLAAPWRRRVREVVDADRAALPAALDAAVRSVDLAPRPPRWWSAARAVQWLLLAVAVGGGLWLAALAVLAYLQLPHPSPDVGRAPVPTVLLVGGAALGLLLAVLARPLIGAGARRRRARVARQLGRSVRAVARDGVLARVDAELAAVEDFCSALAAAGR